MSENIIQLNDIIYVNKHGLNISKEPNIQEFKVKKVSRDSFIAEDLTYKIPIEFDKKDMRGNNYGIHYKAYIDKNVYWKAIKEAEEIDTMLENMTFEMKRLSIDELKELNDTFTIIKNRRNI